MFFGWTQSSLCQFGNKAAFQRCWEPDIWSMLSTQYQIIRSCELFSQIKMWRKLRWLFHKTRGKKHCFEWVWWETGAPVSIAGKTEGCSCMWKEVMWTGRWRPSLGSWETHLVVQTAFTSRSLLSSASRRGYWMTYKKKTKKNQTLELWKTVTNETELADTVKKRWKQQRQPSSTSDMLAIQLGICP